jgi:hypothetical protein
MDVVNEGLSPIHVNHHYPLTGLCWRRVSGCGCRLWDGWSVKLVDENSDEYLRASRTKLRQHVCCNIVVADDVVELETI